jgi:hypothetical protein
VRLGSALLGGLAIAISWITMGSGCGTTDLGAFQGVRDLKLDENFYFCHVQPEVITPQRCSPGGAGDGSGACHAEKSSMILADVETPTPCTNGRPNSPPTADERANYSAAQLQVSRNVEASPLLTNPTGVNPSHPRKIFDTNSPEANTIRKWIQGGT